MMSPDEVEREISEAEEFFQCNVEFQSRDHIRFLVHHANGNARHLVCMWRMGFIDGEIREIKRKINALSGSSRPVVGDAAESTGTGGNSGNHSERR